MFLCCNRFQLLINIISPNPFSLNTTASRDPELTYNKMSIERLAAVTTPPLDWSTYLVRGITIPHDNDWNWSKYFSLIGKAPEVMGEVNQLNSVYLIHSPSNEPTLLFSHSESNPDPIEPVASSQSIPLPHLHLQPFIVRSMSLRLMPYNALA